MLGVEVFESNVHDAWLVQQFENYSFDGSQVVDKFIPRPHVSAVFHFKQRPHFVDEVSFILDPFFLAPIIPRAFTLKFSGDIDTLVVTCKATVFSRLFILDLSPVPKKSIHLPYPIFHPLWQNMASLKNNRERMNCFSEFINSIQSTPYVPDAVDLFYTKILEKSVTVPLKDIIRECYVSKSTLMRKFVTRTGVSPKTLARIVRLNYAWHKIVNENSVDYKVAIPKVGALNSLREEFTPGGPVNISEFGTITIEEEFKALIEMDAYHNIEKGVKYPAQLITTGFNDPRVTSYIPAKFAAKMQNENGSNNPVFLDVDYKSGHFGGSTIDEQFVQSAKEYAFLLWQCGDKEFQQMK